MLTLLLVILWLFLGDGRREVKIRADEGDLVCCALRFEGEKDWDSKNINWAPSWECEKGDRGGRKVVHAVRIGDQTCESLRRVKPATLPPPPQKFEEKITRFSGGIDEHVNEMNRCARGEEDNSEFGNCLKTAGNKSGRRNACVAVCLAAALDKCRENEPGRRDACVFAHSQARNLRDIRTENNLNPEDFNYGEKSSNPRKFYEAKKDELSITVESIEAELAQCLKRDQYIISSFQCRQEAYKKCLDLTGKLLRPVVQDKAADEELSSFLKETCTKLANGDEVSGSFVKYFAKLTELLQGEQQKKLEEHLKRLRDERKEEERLAKIQKEMEAMRRAGPPGTVIPQAPGGAPPAGGPPLGPPPPGPQPPAQPQFPQQPPPGPQAPPSNLDRKDPTLKELRKFFGLDFSSNQ